MLPEWSLPYFQENYTGPWLSDGKFQGSVANGKAKTKSKLDALSREHDTAYALCKDSSCLRKADRVYYDKTRSMSLVPRIAGNLVRYWNDPFQLFDMGADTPGLLKRGVKMGNENGRERAQRLRAENHQIDGKDWIRPSSPGGAVTNTVCYMPTGEFVSVGKAKSEFEQTGVTVTTWGGENETAANEYQRDPGNENYARRMTTTRLRRKRKKHF